MDKETKKLAYELKIQKLIEDIKVIMNQPISKAEQSVKIMARLREEYIYAKNSYINLFKGDVPFVTIYLYADEVKPELEEGDVEGTKSNQYCKIYANSFGPFNADEFFKQEKKIVWILKESYMKSGEYEDFKSVKRSSLGKHNQGEEYYNVGWKVIKQPPVNDGNPTMANLIKISKVILEKQGEIFTGSEQEIMQQVMDHICILEANHFPGFALNKATDSNNEYINEWLLYSEEFLAECLKLYTPKLVIIGGKQAMSNLIKYKYNGNVSMDTAFFNWIRVSKVRDFSDESEYYILGRKIREDSDNQKVMKKSGLNEDTQRAGIFQDYKGTIWFPWFHPGPRLFNIYWNSEWENQEKSTLDEIVKLITRYVQSRNQAEL